MSAWINARRREIPDVRWVDSSLMHITLKFCGERQEETISLLRKNLAAITPCGGLDLRIEGCGGFPDVLRPRVIWAGIAGELNKLSNLQKNVDLAALHSGIDREKHPFSPHLTLGRRNSVSPLAEAALRGLRGFPLQTGFWHASEIIFMQSELSPKGPTYTPLELFKI